MVLSPTGHLVRCRHCRSMILNTDLHCFKCGAGRLKSEPRNVRARLIRCRCCGSMMLDSDPMCASCGREHLGFRALRVARWTWRRILLPLSVGLALAMIAVGFVIWRQQLSERRAESVRAVRSGVFR